ncbi:MAG: aldehyde dehydrogenase (NADP(+)) [Bacteroidota bacterium]
MITNNLIAGLSSGKGNEVLKTINPDTRMELEASFKVAIADEVNEAVESASQAYLAFKKVSGPQKATLLRNIAEEIEKLGDVLVERAMTETGLPEGRIKGERGRTCNQLRLFADLVEEGSWVNATIDKALPNRQPNPRVDIRKISVAIGPVAVFTASNFPLAFSTAGGDTASALAAGCPVVVKAHPSHLGTNALVAEAISKAVDKSNLPKGIFSALNGGIETGQQLVQHPLIKAVGFTGSLKGGKALFDLANSRSEPIPVYAEMGSNNPIFILPDKLKAAATDLAQSIASSVNLGAGQFCTNPGILVLQKSEASETFLAELTKAFAVHKPQTMLNQNIYKAYEQNKKSCVKAEGVDLLYEASTKAEEWLGQSALASVSANDFLNHSKLQTEVFGPFTLAVICEDEEEYLQVAKQLHGQLTATIMGTIDELKEARTLIDILTQKAGRIIFNGVPTGVEVSPAMHHGGPYPATTSPLFTSVGTDAIQRFVRPICYQNAPLEIFPPELQPSNPLQIWRTVNGKITKE